MKWCSVVIDVVGMSFANFGVEQGHTSHFFLEAANITKTFLFKSKNLNTTHHFDCVKWNYIHVS